MLQDLQVRRDVATHIFADDSAVVFNEGTQQLLAFDPLATHLWQRWGEGRREAELAVELATAASLSVSAARDMISDCVETWQQYRLLSSTVDAGSPTRAGSMDDDTNADARSDESVPMPAATTGCMDIRLARTTYRLRFGSEAVADLMRSLLGALERPANGAPIAVFDLDHDGDEILLGQDGVVIDRCTAADEVAPMLKYNLNVDLLERGGFAMAFHAAAVTCGDKALLLPAASGFGKSTLTAALLHDGFDYLADDSVLLDAEEPKIQGVGFGPGVKESAWAVLRDRYPDIDDAPVHRRGDGHRIRYLRVATPSGFPDRTYPIAWIVFPRYRHGAACALQRLAPADSLRRLLKDAYAPGRRLLRRHFARLAALVERTPCHGLTYHDLDEAVAAVRRICQ